MRMAMWDEASEVSPAMWDYLLNRHAPNPMAIVVYDEIRYQVGMFFDMVDRRNAVRVIENPRCEECGRYQPRDPRLPLNYYEPFLDDWSSILCTPCNELWVQILAMFYERFMIMPARHLSGLVRAEIGTGGSDPGGSDSPVTGER